MVIEKKKLVWQRRKKL